MVRVGFGASNQAPDQPEIANRPKKLLKELAYPLGDGALALLVLLAHAHEELLAVQLVLAGHVLELVAPLHHYAVRAAEGHHARRLRHKRELAHAAAAPGVAAVLLVHGAAVGARVAVEARAPEHVARREGPHLTRRIRAKLFYIACGRVDRKVVQEERQTRQGKTDRQIDR